MVKGLDSFREKFQNFSDCYTVIGGAACDILMTDADYNFMIKGRKIVDGICVLGAEYLIPFKMFAWLDLSERKQKGEHVNEKDIKKHKYDVFRLLQLVPTDMKITVEGLVRENIEDFINKIETETLPLNQIGLPFEKEQAIHLLREIYN